MEEKEEEKQSAFKRAMNSLRRKNQGLPAEEKYDIQNETKDEGVLNETKPTDLNERFTQVANNPTLDQLFQNVPALRKEVANYCFDKYQTLERLNRKNTFFAGNMNETMRMGKNNIALQKWMKIFNNK